MNHGRPDREPGPAPASQSGFTLIEVIIALVVTALSVAALVSVIGTSLDVGDRLDTQDRLGMTARSVLAELGTSIPIGPLAETGSQQTLNGETATGETWQAILTRKASATPLVFPVEVALSVMVGDASLRLYSIRAVAPPVPEHTR